MAKPLIQVRGLRKEYPMGDETVVALRDLDLDIEKGQIVCIFGPSGSGKSTLLNQLAGLERPTRGSVTIGGVPVDRLTPWPSSARSIWALCFSPTICCPP